MDDNFKITTLNKRIACEAVSSNSTVIQVKSGVALIQQKTKLNELTVFFDSEDGKYKKGDTVYLHGSTTKHAFMMETYEHSTGEKFILVQEELVFMVKRKVEQSTHYTVSVFGNQTTTAKL